VQASADHGLRAEAVAAAEDHRHERHAEPCPGHQQPGGVTNQSRRLGLPADHVPRSVDERDDRQPEGVAQLKEAGCLVGGLAGERSGAVTGVVGDHTDRPALDPRKGRDELWAEALAKNGHRPLVGQRLDDRDHPEALRSRSGTSSRSSAWSAAGPGALTPPK